jgi:glycosyltransferase involved in cell wall biosynthesis
MSLKCINNSDLCDLIIFSPLPPTKNGIADYCYELLPELSKYYRVYVVVDNNTEKPEYDDRYSVIFLAEFMHRKNEFTDANYLYQIGNNQDHDYILPILIRQPGILILHDITLHHLIDQVTLRYGLNDQYYSLLQYEYGSAGKILANQFRDYFYRETLMFYEAPLIKLITSRSLVTIVHSSYAKTKVLAQEPNVQVEVVNHHLAQSALHAVSMTNKSSARKKLKIDDDVFLIISLGFITKSKQIDAILSVLASIKNKMQKFVYVLAGHNNPNEYDVQKTINQHELSECVIVTGYLSESDFYDYCISADLVLNLRYPTGGETSGTLIRALGVGACLVVVDIGPFSELPDTTCIKIPWGSNFTQNLTEVILDLAYDSNKRYILGKNAREYIRLHHDVSVTALSYVKAIETSKSNQVAHLYPSHVCEFSTPKDKESILQSLASISIPLWFREQQIPLAEKNGSQNILVFGKMEAPEMLLNRLGYNNEFIKIFPFLESLDTVYNCKNDSIDYVILSVTEFPADDKWGNWLLSLNKILKVNGTLIISINDNKYTNDLNNKNKISNSIYSFGFELINYLTTPVNASLSIDTNEKSDRNYAPCLIATKKSRYIIKAI